MSTEPPSKFTFRGVTVDRDTDILDTMLLLARSGTPLDAMEFIDDYAAWLRSNGYGDDDAHRLATENLGYLCGYLAPNEADELYDFFEIEHPILGREGRNMTSKEIFERGAQWMECHMNGTPLPPLPIKRSHE